jgi:alaS: alanine--tRNA ligase
LWRRDHSHDNRDRSCFYSE